MTFLNYRLQTKLPIYQPDIVYRMINNKRMGIEIYPTSDCPGSPIKDALTGKYFLDKKVGKKNDQIYLFKVSLCMGENENGPIHLYYSHPSEYEKQFDCEIRLELKEKWQERFFSYQRDKTEEGKRIKTEEGKRIRNECEESSRKWLSDSAITLF
jgi:hypothetical protein